MNLKEIKKDDGYLAYGENYSYFVLTNLFFSIFK